MCALIRKARAVYTGKLPCPWRIPPCRSFGADTPRWSYFSPGDEVDVVVSDTAYPAVDRSEEELGLEHQEKVAEENAYVYFALKEPTFDLEDGDRGSVTLVLDERHDALLVPSEAISSAGGQPSCIIRMKKA